MSDPADKPASLNDDASAGMAARRLLWDETKSAIDALGLQIHGELSHGATAVVFEAKERQTGRRLAIKVIFDPGDQQAMALFRRECRILGSDYVPNDLVPHYVTSAGWGDAENNAGSAQPFVVMELIDGKKIHEYALCNPDRLPIPRRIDLVKHLYQAVHHLHECNLLHGDLSSNNVLVERGGRIRICDFGQSKRLLGGYHSVNSASGRFGTPGFAPGTQLFGEESAAPWTDIRQASAIAYHIFTGKVPDGSHTSHADEWRRELKRSGVPAEIARIVVKGLRERDFRGQFDSQLYVDANDASRDIDLWEIRRRRRVSFLRQTALFLVLLIPVAALACTGWEKYRAAVVYSEQRQYEELRSRADRLPHLDHPAIASLLQRADESIVNRQLALDEQQTRRSSELLADAVALLTAAIDTNEQIDRCGPIRADLSTVLERTTWISSSPRIAALYAELSDENRDLERLIESGEASQSWNRLVAFSAQLARATRENAEATEANEQRLRYDRLESAIPKRLKLMDGFQAIDRRTVDASTAWDLGDWQNAALHYGQALQQLDAWFRDNASTEELASIEQAAENALKAMQSEQEILLSEQKVLEAKINMQLQEIAALQQDLMSQGELTKAESRKHEQVAADLRQARADLARLTSSQNAMTGRLARQTDELNRSQRDAAEAHQQVEIWRKAAKNSGSSPPDADLPLELLSALAYLDDGDFTGFVEQYYPPEHVRRLREMPGGVAGFTEEWAKHPTDVETLQTYVRFCSRHPAAEERGGTLARFDVPTEEDSPANAAADKVPPGLGDDLEVVLKSAISLLETGNLRGFVLNLFPEPEARRLQGSADLEDLILVLNDQQAMVSTMLADLITLQTLTPTVADGVAGFKQVVATARGDRIHTVRFQLINGNWRFYDNVSAARSRIDQFSPAALDIDRDRPVVRWEMLGSRWRLHSLDFLRPNSPLIPGDDDVLEPTQGD